ncbi:hypothetical protein CUMW_210990 [Citrus unshiu]|uniref:NAC domain-containing protein n=1 Tax=Citrus unshiu TaxID=55188 RepID=A0A2H5QAA5_CITUN|nr:hypothetical protein CUMW_210990 [Citrus unshiu]
MQFGGTNLEDGKDLYFFTPLKKKSANGSRIDRRVSSVDATNSNVLLQSLEENYQQSQTQQDPHDLELSDHHQNMQDSPVTNQSSCD